MSLTEYPELLSPLTKTYQKDVTYTHHDKFHLYKYEKVILDQIIQIFKLYKFANLKPPFSNTDTVIVYEMTCIMRILQLQYIRGTHGDLYRYCSIGL